MLPSRLKIEKCPSQREKAFPKFQISKISKISDFWKMANFRKKSRILEIFGLENRTARLDENA